MDLQKLIIHLQELSPKPFKEKDIKICGYLYKCTLNKSLNNLSIRRCANYLKISPSALVRFGKKIGFSGFNEIKDYIANLVCSSSLGLALTKKEINDYCQLTYYLTQKSININISSFNDLANLLTNNHKVLIYGEGVSGLIVQYFAIALSKIGIFIYTVDLISSFEREVAELKNSDGVILVSQSGETLSVINKAKKAQDLNLPIFSITNHQPNTLASLSKVNIKIVANSDYNTKLNKISYNSVTFFLIDFFIQELLLNKNQEAIKTKDTP